MNECPVFLEEPGKGDAVYSLGHKVPYRPFLMKEFFKMGQVWRTREGSTKYPNNPAVYKLLQIIFRDYGGHGPYSLTFVEEGLHFEPTFEVSRSYTNKPLCNLTFKEKPDVTKIVEEMGPLMEYFR